MNIQQYKFRGKRKDNEQWIFGHYYDDVFKNGITGEVIYHKHFIRGANGEVFDGIFHSTEVYPETVSIFVCMLGDKEVYVDDILFSKRINNYGKVVFGAFHTMTDDWNISECSPKFCIQWDDGGHSRLECDDAVYEKVGNIHDNKDLFDTPDPLPYDINEPVIWDSGFGYELGYFLGKGSGYQTGKIDVITGITLGECSYPLIELKPYNDENLRQCFYKYGYEKQISKIF